MNQDLDGWHQYIEWVCVGQLKMDAKEFSKYNALIHTLVKIPFTYIHPMDENRLVDGLSLRKEYEHVTEADLSLEPNYLEQVSVFEVIAALAIRCENAIMRDVTIGDRTKVWFFEMLQNLDILKWDFEHLQYEYTDDICQKVNRWMKREIEKDGTGGLFPLKHPHTNQKNEQLWNQMMAYCRENWIEQDPNEIYASDWYPSTY